MHSVITYTQVSMLKEREYEKAQVRLYFLRAGHAPPFTASVNLEHDYLFSQEAFPLDEFDTTDSMIRFLGARSNQDNNGSSFRPAKQGDVVLVEISQPAPAFMAFYVTEISALRKTKPPQEVVLHYDGLTGLALFRVRTHT